MRTRWRLSESSTLLPWESMTKNGGGMDDEGDGVGAIRVVSGGGGGFAGGSSQQNVLASDNEIRDGEQGEMCERRE